MADWEGTGQQAHTAQTDCLQEALQDAHPEAVLLGAELLGNLSSLGMPFNIQNLVGNWLVLIGQILLVFNAQQQLWENGPGRCYSRRNKNIDQTTEHTVRTMMGSEPKLSEQSTQSIQIEPTEQSTQAEPSMQLLQQELRELRSQVAELQRQLQPGWNGTPEK